MKTYRELNLEEKNDIEVLINEVKELLPKDNNFFDSETIDENDKKILKTKQDYNDDKNKILQIIEEKRKIGQIEKEYSKKLKIAVTILFNEFIRIAPKKTYTIEAESKQEKTNKKIHMHIGDLYIKIEDTYVKIPEKVLYKVVDIPGNEEKQTLQYFITTEENIDKLDGISIRK